MTTHKTVQKLPWGLSALKMIVEGTSEHTGEKFFRSLVKSLAQSLDAHGVWITEYLSEQNRLRSFAFWLDDHFVDEYEYVLHIINKEFFNVNLRSDWKLGFNKDEYLDMIDKGMGREEYMKYLKGNKLPNILKE